MATRTATPAGQQNAPETAQDPWADAPKCGHPVNMAKGQKPCVKPAGHTEDGSRAFTEFGKGHVSRIQKRREYKPITKKVTGSFELVPTTERVEYGAGRSSEERSDRQIETDGHVTQVHELWVNAGRPKLGFNEMIAAGLAARYFLDSPEDEESVRAMLKSAGRFSKRGGKDTPAVSVRVAPVKEDEKGRPMLYWIAIDVNPHEKSNGNGSGA